MKILLSVLFLILLSSCSINNYYINRTDVVYNENTKKLEVKKKCDLSDLKDLDDTPKTPLDEIYSINSYKEKTFKLVDYIDSLKQYINKLKKSIKTSIENCSD